MKKLNTKFLFDSSVISTAPEMLELESDESDEESVRKIEMKILNTRFLFDSLVVSESEKLSKILEDSDESHDSDEESSRLIEEENNK